MAGLSLTSTAAGSQDISTVESSVFFKGNSPIASYDDASFAPHGQELSTKGSKISPHDYIATNTRAVSEPVTKDEKHRRPIRAALSLSYPLNDVLWLESGLTYSMLYSSFTTSSGVTVSEALTGMIGKIDTHDSGKNNTNTKKKTTVLDQIKKSFEEYRDNIIKKIQMYH